ncbi:MAG: hypothetical protein QOG63_1925 [Thermoleophilaceae bacterium]|nr:hypothetical protein [Thermoleophilaceae bacterium]
MTVVAIRPEEAARVRLSPVERLELLFDRGSLQRVRSGVRSRRLGAKAREGDGAVGATGLVGGRPVAAYAQDASFAGGSVGEAHADTIAGVLRLADRARVPVVGFVESGGARMQEGLAALAGYGRIFRANVALTRRVPQISIVAGVSAGGGCYSPALTDFVVMTEDAHMFLTGPRVVRDVIGEDASAADLGGRRVHERNGVCQFVVESDVAAAGLARELLAYLPQSVGAAAPPEPPAPAAPGDPGDVLPPAARQAYDVRQVIERVVDRGRLLEFAPKWARNMVTGFARLDGRAVGVIANQAGYLGGLLDVDASQKGALFVRTCNRFGLPLVVLVDTPGFMPGRKQEKAGVIRHGATLVDAFAGATVPSVTVVLRKAYGGGYIAMNSHSLGADLTFAWPGATIGIMGAAQAVAIAHRRELEEAVDPESLRRRLTAAYVEQHLSARVAAHEGVIDEVIAPGETRGRLCSALATIGGTHA